MIVVATGVSKLWVKVGEERVTDEFDVISGIKQEDELSPMLFHLALEPGISKVNKNTRRWSDIELDA